MKVLLKCAATRSKLFQGLFDLIPVLQIDENDFERNEIHAEVHHMVDDDYMVDSYCL